MKYVALSQSITNNKVTIPKEHFVKIMKDVRKYDSLKVFILRKDEIIKEVISNNTTMFESFREEREIKTKYLKELEELRKVKDKKKAKRFGLGVSIGASLNSEQKVVPSINLGLNYSIFRF